MDNGVQQDQNNSDIPNQDNNSSSIPKNQNNQVYSNSMRIAMKEKRKHIISVSMVIVLVGAVGIFLASKSDKYITFGDDFFANNAEESDINGQVENGYTFAFGTEPNDTTDYSTYSITPASPELRQEFLYTINNSEAFDETDSVYELIDYNQFDKDGNISEQAMQDIINIGNAVEQ